jgi:hypothetical protein
MEGSEEGFHEPRLVLYSASSEHLDLPKSSAAALARRKRLQNQQFVAPNLEKAIDPPAIISPTTSSSLFPSLIPTNIVVHQRPHGKSSLCSVVSEITQPVELAATPPRRVAYSDVGVGGPGRDIEEMKQ